MCIFYLSVYVKISCAGPFNVPDKLADLRAIRVLIGRDSSFCMRARVNRAQHRVCGRLTSAEDTPFLLSISASTGVGKWEERGAAEEAAEDGGRESASRKARARVRRAGPPPFLSSHLVPPSPSSSPSRTLIPGFGNSSRSPQGTFPVTYFESVV